MEGLAYLTFDADVKEDLVEDKHALTAMFELAKVYLFILLVSLNSYQTEEKKSKNETLFWMVAEKCVVVVVFFCGCAV